MSFSYEELQAEGLDPLLSKCRILIVDDEPDNIWFLAGVLKDTAIIHVARDGETALRSARTYPQPELILLDVQMPGMDGYEVCRRLKNSPDTRAVSIIFVTASCEAGSEARGLTLGAEDYIHKPFDPAIVKARVRAQVEIKRHRDLLGSLVRERTRALRKTQEGTIKALAALAEWRDTDTGAHIRRTQEFVRLLARQLTRNPRHVARLTPDFIDMLYLCAPLHDVGKVSIPDAILFKPGKLTVEEFAIMKKHAQFGADILQQANKDIGGDPFLELAYEVARWHHARWDGKGYPDNIGGERIPLSARIMAVADVYDALVSTRPYKTALPHEEAVRIISEESGSRFDPEVIDAFLQVREDFRVVAARINSVAPEERQWTED